MSSTGRQGKKRPGGCEADTYTDGALVEPLSHGTARQVVSSAQALAANDQGKNQNCQICVNARLRWRNGDGMLCHWEPGQQASRWM